MRTAHGYALALLCACACASSAAARSFNITSLVIPPVVPSDQSEVEIECRYDANFTLLNWFKGPNEFFRYKPGSAPSTRSFPILGIGRVELITCGPVACRLRLGGLTEEASGLYRCDIERDVPPYQFASQKAFMVVDGHEHRRPLLEGLEKEFGEGDEMKAYCRGAPDSELRWYVNGREEEEMRGSANFRRNSSRLIFQGIPPTVTVQCAEFRFGRLSGSKEVKANWKELRDCDETPQEQRNFSPLSITLSSLILICMYLVSLKNTCLD